MKVRLEKEKMEKYGGNKVTRFDFSGKRRTDSDHNFEVFIILFISLSICGLIHERILTIEFRRLSVNSRILTRARILTKMTGILRKRSRLKRD